jgi:hypothetical protein
VIDPYNDFICEGGKVWDRLKGVADANKCVPHMMQVLNAARTADHPRFLCAASPRQRVGIRWHDGSCGYGDSCRRGDFVTCQPREILSLFSASVDFASKLSPLPASQGICAWREVN